MTFEEELKEITENPISWAVKERDKYWKKRIREGIDVWVSKMSWDPPIKDWTKKTLKKELGL